MFRKLLAVLFLLCVTAPLARAQDYPLSSDQRALLDQTCSQVMGLKPGETWFARCRESLSAALPAGPARPVIAAADTGTMLPGASFYEVSPTMRWNRERQACDRMGLVPGGVSFHQCVTGLDGAFLPSPN